MKVFCVSKDCNACGECILSTDLLSETADGFAIPTAGKYIEDNNLDQAKKLAARCPVGALSIIEQSSVAEKGKAGLSELAQVLESRMRAIEIPDVSYQELKFKESEYTIEHGWVDEYKTKYPSWDKAMRAGQEQFEAVYWNRMQDFVVNALTQYRSRVLRPYYDLSNLKNTYYAGIGNKMTSILNEIKAEACSLAGAPLSFPDDFTQFYPEKDQWFLKYLTEQYDGYAVSYSYINSCCEGFKKEDEQHGRDYRLIGRIVAEEYGQMTVKTLFGTSQKPTYRMKDVNDTGIRMINNLLSSLAYPGDYGPRSIDDLYADDLKFVMSKYRELVDKEISKKVEDFRKIISATKGPVKKLESSERCPSCGKRLIIRHKKLYCGNPECADNLIGLFTHFFEEMGLEGYNDAFSEMLVKKMKCTSLGSVIRLDDRCFEYRGTTSAMTKGFADKLKEAIGKHRDYEVLGALGLPGVGPAEAKILLEQLKNMPYSEILEEPGPQLRAACVAAVGEEQAESLYGYMIGPVFGYAWYVIEPYIKDASIDTAQM